MQILKEIWSIFEKKKLFSKRFSGSPDTGMRSAIVVFNALAIKSLFIYSF